MQTSVDGLVFFLPNPNPKIKSAVNAMPGISTSLPVGAEHVQGRAAEAPLTKPIINCHTHIFTGDHVPPFLAKAFLPWPIYTFIPLSMVVALFRFWYDYPDTWRFKPLYRTFKEKRYAVEMFIKRIGVLRIIVFFIGLWLTLHVFYIAVDWISTFKPLEESTGMTLDEARDWLTKRKIMFIPASTWGKLGIVLLLIIFFKSGRNMILFVLKKLWAFLEVLPGPKSRELARRYLNIGRFAFYENQTRIFGRLKSQYPTGTAFIVLPMDMEFMKAGSLKKGSRYHDQMRQLLAIKKNEEHGHLMYPFVFAEPRRMELEGESHFSYRVENGNVILNNCFIKQFIEQEKFSGFKIYPALGYYPFDELLLPLWKYAADNGIPILTHCIRGTIYYRGTKLKAWDYHPVFEQPCGDQLYEPMALIQTKNSEFSNNFTHPLNYLCLLEEKLLRKLLISAKSDRVREVFGYTNEDTPLKHNLSHLKICFGHFGGDDEWDRFLELDRDNFASQLVKHPDKGTSFLTDDEGNPRRGKAEQIWKYQDWYSIICSLMLQYQNVYADLSYILHNTRIHPLLKLTLLNPKLKTRTLFGTDFYVVRNHNSEKSLLAGMIDHLSEEEFDQIARINPREFLENKLHGPITI